MDRNPTTYATGQIADVVHDLAGEPAGLTERIRSWGRLGLLIAVDQFHSGTGKHVRYNDTAPYDAAFLTVLADAGLPVTSQRVLADGMARARIALTKWAQARRTGRATAPLCLDLHFIPPRMRMIEIREGAGAKPAMLAEFKREQPDRIAKDAFAAVTVTIDLGRIFEAVWAKGCGLDTASAATAEKESVVPGRSIERGAFGSNKLKIKRGARGKRGGGGGG